MGDQFVSQREFDRYREAADRERAQLRDDQRQIRQERDDDIKAAVAIAVAEALKSALKELGESRNTSWMRRIGAVGAGAAVVAAWVALIELLHASGR